MLLSYNEYNCSEIGGYTVYIVNDDSLEPEYKQGSILLIKRTSDKNVQKGDEMFLYKVISSQEFEFVERTLDSKLQQGNHVTYVAAENGENYDSSYFVGKTSDTVCIEGWGYLLSLLESKWGYLFCVVIVSLLLFLQEVFELAMEIKYGREVKKARQESTSSKATEKAEKSESETEVREESKPTKTVAKKTTSKPRANNTTKTASTAHKETSKGTKATSKKTVKEEKKANSEE